MQRAANVECCCCRCCSPQLGQLASSGLRTNFSKAVPQSSHVYSNIGIKSPRQVHSTSALATLSTQSRTSVIGAAKLFTKMENASGPELGRSA